MSLDLDILSPLTYPGWNGLVLASGGGSFFHSSYWARVLHESYGYKPVYFASIGKNRFETLSPFMEVDSPLTGRRGVSLPFTDYCEPILPGDGDAGRVMDGIIGFGKKSGWKYAELRSGGKLPSSLRVSSEYYGHVLDIGRDEKAVFSGFRESTRRNIRKAGKEGVKVTVSASSDAVGDFYRLNCMTRKVHGLPPQPFRFFEIIHKYVLSSGHGIVVLAERGGAKVAGAMYFHFGDKAIYKYGASDRRHQHLRANNLVMWEAIKHYSAMGCKTFCFGRTDPGNDGLMRFKRGWGGEEQSIKYYKYDLRQESFVKDTPMTYGFHNEIFSRMPIPLLRFTGSLLYRHLG